MACFGDTRLNEKQTKHFVFLIQCNYLPNKIIFLGNKLVGVEFVGAELVGGRVGKGPSLLGAEFVRGRVC